MRELGRAATLLAHTLLRRDERVGQPYALAVDGEPVPCDVYRPPDRPWATVALIHGLTLRAHRDPRLVAAAQALTRAGVRAVVPRIAPLAELSLSCDTHLHIRRVLRGIMADPGLAGPGRLRVISASFGAGQLLRAAAHRELSPHLGELLLVGPYADAPALLRHLLTSPGADPYGRWLVLSHFLEEGPVRDAVRLALRDDSLGGEPQLPTALARLCATERERFEHLARGPEGGRELYALLLATRAEQVQALSVLPSLPSVRAPVSLLHGRRDAVIPASESVRIAQALTAPVRLHLSDLLDHGDLGSPWRALAEGPSLLRALGQFLQRP